MEQLFAGPPCSICDGTMTKVSETEAVCFNDEQHKRKIRLVGVANLLPFDSTGAGGLSLAFYGGTETI
jgi:hypothetical protein